MSNDTEKYFGEKSPQIDTDTITAFGIGLTSRYAKAKEMMEMLKFARLLAAEGVHTYVKEVFYDSKAGLCSFTFTSDIKDGTAIAQIIESAAINSISQFEMFGYINHGADLRESVL